MVEARTKPPNPFRSIWFHPRDTIRRVLEHHPKRFVIALFAAPYVLSVFIDTQQFAKLNDICPVWVILLACVGFMLMFAVITLYIFAWGIRIAGSWLGGLGDTVGVRAAMGWSNVPVMAGSLLLLVMGLIMQYIFGMTDLAQIDGSTAGAMIPWMIVVVVLLAVNILLGCWTFILLCKTVGEVHGFSAWRGWGSVSLGGLIAMIPWFITFTACMSGAFFVVKTFVSMDDINTRLNRVAQSTAGQQLTGQLALNMALGGGPAQSGTGAVPPVSEAGLARMMSGAVDRLPVVGGRPEGTLRRVHEAMRLYHAAQATYTTLDVLIEGKKPYLSKSGLEVAISPPFYFSIPNYFIMQYDAPSTDAYCVEARPIVHKPGLQRYGVDATGVVQIYDESFWGQACAGLTVTPGGQPVNPPAPAITK